MNKKILAITPSVTLGIAARAKALAAQGRSICSFAAGEPDFDTPRHIKEAAAKALMAGETKYTPSDGLKALQTAVVEKFARDNGLTYKPEQVIISNGAKHSLFNIFMAILGEGDEVIIPAPFWLSYPEMVLVSGGRSVIVQAREENGFKLTAAELEAAITPRSRAVVINSPSNPIGLVYSREELAALARVAVKHNLYIVSDEIYEKLVYEGAEHVSIGSLGADVFARTITVNGFSKSYSMTGWRLGYFAGPADVVQAASALQSHSTSGPNTFAQFGAVAALREGAECIQEMVRAFDERRRYLYKRLTSIPGVTCVKPLGAFYALPNISKLGLDSVAFSERIMEEQGVAVVPGKSFGNDATVRLSYACAMSVIEEGMNRFERFAASLA